MRQLERGRSTRDSSALIITSLSEALSTFKAVVRLQCLLEHLKVTLFLVWVFFKSLCLYTMNLL